MVDIDKVSSGFDIELVLGTRFFSGILRTLFDSKQIPNSWTRQFAGYQLTVAIIPDYSVRFGNVVQGAILVHTGFDIRVDSPAGSFLLPNMELGLACNFTADKNGGNSVEAITVEIRFWELSAGWESRIPVDLQPYREDLRQLLWDELVVSETTGLAGGTIQDFFMRVYEESSSHTGGVGLYFNLPFAKEADGTRFGPRGSLSAAQCLLPSKEHAFAFGMSKEVYHMLGVHLKQTFAEKQSDGSYEYPLYKNQKAKFGKMGRLQSVTVLPRTHPPDDLFVPIPVNENALFAALKARVKHMSINADLYVRLKVEPSINGRALGIDVDVDRTDIDVDWEDLLQGPLIIAGIFGFIGAVAGGFMGLAIGAAFYGGLVGIAEGIGVRYAEGLVRSALQGAVDPNVAPLKALPRQVTIVPKRWDPFYLTHYQVVGGFDSCEVHFDGLTACGFADGVTTTDVVYHDIEIVDVVRNEAGDVTDFVYRVGEPDQIVEPWRCRTPEGRPEGHFMLSPEEAYERINKGRLHSSAYVRPTHVCMRGKQIRYIKFDTGLVLSPHEAGTLQSKSVLGVLGYDLVYMRRRQRFYYRAKADSIADNNLSQLPSFDPPDEMTD